MAKEVKVLVACGSGVARYRKECRSKNSSDERYDL